MTTTPRASTPLRAAHIASSTAAPSPARSVAAPGPSPGSHGGGLGRTGPSIARFAVGGLRWCWSWMRLSLARQRCRDVGGRDLSAHRRFVSIFFMAPTGPCGVPGILAGMATNRAFQQRQDMRLMSLLVLSDPRRLRRDHLAQLLHRTHGGAADDKIPPFEVSSALRADASTMPFLIRQPALPAGWKPNFRDIRANRGKQVSTVGWITPGGCHLGLQPVRRHRVGAATLNPNADKGWPVGWNRQSRSRHHQSGSPTSLGTGLPRATGCARCGLPISAMRIALSGKAG